MPNQRKKGKRSIGTWIESSVVDYLDAEAKRRNIHRSELVASLVREGLIAYETSRDKTGHKRGSQQVGLSEVDRDSQS